MNKIIRIIVIIAFLAVNIGCDRVTKYIARENINYGDQIGYLKNHVTFTRVENTGAFLSLGNKLPEPFRIVLLIGLPALALIFALVYLISKPVKRILPVIALTFILGGGLGNLYDRAVHGSVTDFMHINFVIFQTGIFNMADVSIMAGLLILVADIILKRNYTK